MQQFIIYVCEDNVEHIEKVEEICSSLKKDYPHTFQGFTSPEKLADELSRTGNKDAVLILMDIEMPQVDGITLGKQIKEKYPEITLVFLTAYEEYAVKGYEANAFRYLLKPLTVKGMQQLFSDLQSVFQKGKKLRVKTKEGEELVSLNDLLYISAEDKYSVLYTQGQHFICDYSLSKYEKQLEQMGFFRIHRKYLVNMYHHKAIQSGHVVLSSGVKLPVSKRRAAEYQKALLTYLGEVIV